MNRVMQAHHPVLMHNSVKHPSIEKRVILSEQSESKDLRTEILLSKNKNAWILRRAALAQNDTEMETVSKLSDIVEDAGPYIF